ncbi:hypothetical protein AG0111_0g1452 [Alternaria gaisen]|uniref:Uncharacterized protein n=1 Tax=Alternaria gaisen TaxID=167740 RepID=A0ACB6G2F0_9PLEO|nr:hypothetical protein AG0111_0g1452 [Alternaria gaisen]
MNEIDARVSQGELSTPFEEHYPEPPDYFSQEDFHAAYDHEGFLEMLAKLPKKDVERSSSQDTKLCTPVKVGPVGTHTDFLNAGVCYSSYDADLPLYEPKPQRKHNIAADLEELVGPSTVDEPTTTAGYETSDVTWTQQDIYQYQQNQHNQQKQQNAWQIYAHGYQRQYMEGHYTPRYRSLPQTQAPQTPGATIS